MNILVWRIIIAIVWINPSHARPAPEKIMGSENNEFCAKTDQELEKQLLTEERHDLFEGDIAMDRKTADLIIENSVDARDVLQNEQLRWKTNRIPFVLDKSVGKYLQNVIAAAIRDFETYSCVKFIPRGIEKDYLYIYVGKGCWSYVGRMSGKQEVSFGPGCEYKGTVIHEFMHALGFFHEHTRLDRDKYIKISWGMVQQGMENNFKKYAHGLADYLGEPYDFSSIMHYPKIAFSKDKVSYTITPKKKTDVEIGQRKGFSKIDLKQLNKSFKCYDTMKAATTESPTKPVDPTIHQGKIAKITGPIVLPTKEKPPVVVIFPSTPPRPIAPIPTQQTSTLIIQPDADKSTSRPIVIIPSLPNVRPTRRPIVIISPPDSADSDSDTEPTSAPVIIQPPVDKPTRKPVVIIEPPIHKPTRKPVVIIEPPPVSPPAPPPVIVLGSGIVQGAAPPSSIFPPASAPVSTPVDDSGPCTDSCSPPISTDATYTQQSAPVTDINPSTSSENDINNHVVDDSSMNAQYQAPSPSSESTRMVFQASAAPAPAVVVTIHRNRQNNENTGMAYPSWPNDFSWSSNGVPSCNCNCLNIAEPLSESNSKDNYLCSQRRTLDPGLKWSHSGPIHGKRCIRISHPNAPEYWHNNFLCVPHKSPYNFIWSFRGPIKAKDISCIKMDIPIQQERDNSHYLCAKKSP